MGYGIANTGGTIIGDVMIGKMNEVLECIKEIAQQSDSIQYRASDTLQSTDEYEFTLDDRGKYKKVKQFYAKYDGYIHVNITTKTLERLEMYIFRSLHDYLNIENGTGFSKETMMMPALFKAPENSILNNFKIKTISILNQSSTYKAIEFTNQISGSNTYPNTDTTSSRGYTIMDVVFPVKKGEQVAFVGLLYHTGKNPNSVTIKMYYDEVTI